MDDLEEAQAVEEAQDIFKTVTAMPKLGPQILTVGPSAAVASNVAGISYPNYNNYGSNGYPVHGQSASDYMVISNPAIGSYIQFQNVNDFTGKISLHVSFKEVLRISTDGTVTIMGEEPVDEISKKFADTLEFHAKAWLDKYADTWTYNEVAAKSRKAAFEEVLEFCDDEVKSKVQEKINQIKL